MNKYFSKIVISVLTIFISLNFLSQDVSFVTEVGMRKTGIKDQFYVTYKSNKSGQFIRPSFKNFTIVSGVYQGQVSAISIVNGRQSMGIEYTFQMILQPKKTGKLKLEGGKIKIDGKTYTSNSVVIEVVKESQVKQPKSILEQIREEKERVNKIMRQRQSESESLPDNIFISKIIVSKSEVYLNEPITVTYKIYSRIDRPNMVDLNLTNQENFWAEKIDEVDKTKRIIKNINGFDYIEFTLKKEVLLPQKTGKLKLKPFDVTFLVNQTFINQGTKINSASNSPIITIKELPKSAPESFGNQVGDYEMIIDFKQDTIIIDQPIDLKITIKGKGNLKQMGELSPSFPKDFEVYDPETKDRISVKEGGISGSKIFIYLLIPRKSGKYVIEPIEFSYFDLKSKKYKTLKSKAFNLTVLNEDGTISNVVVEEDDTVEKIEKTKENQSSFSWMYVLFPLLILGLGGLLFLFIRKRKNKEETEEDRKRNARKKLAKNLEIAKNHLDKNNISQFYDEILIGLNKYINDKLQIKTAEMNKENIVKKLKEKKVGESTISSFVGLIEQCEMAKYSPLPASNNHEIYEKSLDVISGIEGEI